MFSFPTLIVNKHIFTKDSSIRFLLKAAFYNFLHRL